MESGLNILSFPDEILLQILRYSPSRDIEILAMTCWTFWRICQEEEFRNIFDVELRWSVKYGIKDVFLRISKFRFGLINLEIPVLVRSLKSSNVELG